MARLGQIIKTLNIGIGTATEFLNKKGQPIDQNPSVKLTDIQESLLLKEFSSDKNLKEKSDKLIQERLEKEKVISIEDVRKIDKETKNQKKKENKKTENDVKPEVEKEIIKDVAIEKEEPKKEELPAVIEQKVEKVEKVKKIEKVEIITPAVPKDKTAKPKEKKTLEQNKKQEIQSVENHIEKEIEEVKEVKESVAGKNIESDNQPQMVEKEFFTKKQKEPQTQESEKTEIQKHDTQGELQKRNEEIFKLNDTKLEVNINILGKIDLSQIGKDSRPKPKSPEERKRDFKEKERLKREAERKLKEQQYLEQKERNRREREARLQREAESREKQKQRSENIFRRFNDKNKPQSAPPQKPPVKEAKQIFQTQVPTLKGPKIVDKVNLDKPKTFNKERPHFDKNRNDSRNNNRNVNDLNDRKKRDRIKIERVDIVEDKNKFGKFVNRERRTNRPVDEEGVNQNIRETMAIARGGKKFNKKGVDRRKEKRESIRHEMERKAELKNAASKTLKLTEFVTANELAAMMNVPVNDVIKVYMNLGMFVGINQRLDAESIKIVVDEFGYLTEFVSAEASKTIQDDEIDDPKDLVFRPPIITVMGHVDHGKTSLLDYIRKTNVIAGEAGGITQHIGAYNVELEDGRRITFLDTPGHEAFTAMRARGAKVTDIAIVVIAADDNVMPQTIEAINHASSAGVPIVFAINKIDKDGADPEKIKATLANMNYMVESWGGKYQSQDISAKKGINVKELLEKVLLEAEMLDLKANPQRKAVGSVIEITKDKGRGNVATLLVENGTLKQGDIVLAGYAYGRIRAMFNERNQPIKEAKPAEPVMILGLKGELQAGDKFNVMETEQQAREIISQRDQLKREQKLRTSHHLTLDEIGRRIAMGKFQELNIIVKGDVDGSIEALSDSLIKLSTPEIQVNVIHKGVGQITEGDVNLAISANAIVVGFQVRPTNSAKHLAEQEDIDIRLYSIIYQAIDEVKSAMEGMLIPEKTEKAVATLEVRNTFHISKVGTIAGCMVKDGTIKRSNKIHLIHDGIVVYTGEIASLKHEKDDVKEVKAGYECGLNIAAYNDIAIGDIIEAFEEVEVKKTLS